MRADSGTSGGGAAEGRPLGVSLPSDWAADVYDSKRAAAHAWRDRHRGGVGRLEHRTASCRRIAYGI